MDFSLYRSMVSSALDIAANANKTVYGTDITNKLKQINGLLSNQVPLILDESSLLSENFTWSEGVSSEEVTLPGHTGTMSQILPLGTGDYLVVNVDAEALQYTNNFTLRQALPFDYATPVTDEYLAPGYSSVIQYSGFDTGNAPIAGSVLFMPIPASHIVQMYKYENDYWTHLGTLGTIATNGNTTGLLDTPVAVDGYYDAANSRFNVLISNSGNGVSGEPSFVKKFEVTLAGVATDKGEVSAPSSATGGSMADGETKNISELIFTAENHFWALSNSENEFGVLDMNTTVTEPDPTTLKMIPGDIKELPYDDILTTPSTFDVSGDTVVVGDSRGHLAIVASDFSDAPVVVGRSRDAVNDTNYPLSFDPILDVRIIGGQVFFISGNKLRTINLLEVTDHQATYCVGPFLVSTTIGKVYGFCEASVEISFDGETFSDPCSVATTLVPIGTQIYVRVSRTAQQVLDKPVALCNGVLMVTI
jgi:hypothetical protein